MLDTVLRGGSVVDGTGAPARRADVGVSTGRVVSVATDVGPARRTVDIEGLVVAPGFVDVHTHYDAQAMWDRSITPSSLHGVTTVIGGNCGFTLAPVDPSSRDYVMQMLACVEGMPVESLAASLSWEWGSFGEWLGQLDGQLALNAGFSVGHSTIRRLVMGEDTYRAATDHEITQMERHVDESLDAGALGFSSSWGEAHGDHLRQPVPSRFSEREELIRLASRLRSRPGTMLEFIPTIEPMFSDRAIAMMVDMSVAAGRPLNWNVLTIGLGADRAAIDRRLSASDVAADHGAKIIALAMPMPVTARVNLLSLLSFNSEQAWADALALPMQDRLRAFSDPETRRELAQAVEGRGHQLFWNFGPMTVEIVGDPGMEDLIGRTVADIASERGTTVVDAFCDIAVMDRFATYFSTPPAGDDVESWERRAALWRDPRVVVGGSDSGAHLDSMVASGYTTDFIGPTVRDRGLASLEEAIHLLTDVPARFYGLKDRGRIATGAIADLVVFDPATVRCGNVVLQNDMPGGQSRLFASSQGIARVFVNGVEVVTDGQPTGATPGTVLRSGRDTT